MALKVLVVDEDEDVLDITGTFLARHDDIEVTTEPDPERALELVLEGGFDAVVSDLTMPDLDGLELCREIRDRYPEIPFFLFTGRDEVDLPADRDCVTGVVQKGTGTDQYDDLADRLREAA